MTESQMIEQLLMAGVSAEKADSLVKAFAGGADTEDAETGDVDVDRLTKAMEGIRDAFDAQPAEEVESAIAEASDIVDAVTKGADALLEEHRGQFEALSKALVLLTEEVSQLRSEMHNERETVVKSLGDAAAALNEPVMRKSMAAEEIPAPGETVESAYAGPSDLISKAISEIQGDATASRKAELRRAITLLESGMAPSSVASTYSL